MNYDHKKIEKKWQKIWEEKDVNRATDGGGKKFYPLVEFPYPSGEGMHVGHVRSYTAMDVIARKRRGEGFNVLYPMGWDAFGLPTENYAVKTGIHPAVVTKTNTDNFRRQLKMLGLSFDWGREINTTDPKYYKWTQWIFLQLFKKGLAYKAKSMINWCPSCKIGLANEEAIGGICERCGGPIEKREKEQWMLAITKYADRLDKDLDEVDYLEKIKIQQRNWIGRSEGAEISFPIKGGEKYNFILLHGFTGRADTNFIPWLKRELEQDGFKVQAPQMPNTDTPVESEQVGYVIKNCHIDENTVLVGHSLGGVVAMKVLEQINRKVAGLVLVAPAVEAAFRTGNPRSYWETFNLTYDYKKIKSLSGFQTILSDSQETQRRPYLDYLSEKLGAPLFEDIAKEEHFTAEIEPFILRNVLPHIRVFTTRADTLFGATYMVVAPEHPIIPKLKESISNWKEVVTYIAKAAKKTEMERTAEGKEKTGVELKGVKAINPANQEEVPIFVADYVLAQYGTGAIMGVPAHDERDFEFAKKYNLPIRIVITQPAPQAGTKETEHYEGKGFLFDSGEFTGEFSDDAREKITEKFGTKKVTYKLRDWVFSRQRYWGEPIPLVYCDKDGWVAIPEDQLPVALPNIKEFKPRDDGQSPLASVTDWVNTTCPKCGGPAKRETDTMPNWAGSSWYYLRYMDPHNDRAFAVKDKLDYWGQVDWYNGGMEHTTLHLLYSRFWHKFLFDEELVPTNEPYAKRTSHGLILAHDGSKMSKSKGNVVNPDNLVETFGADSLRLYEMFMGPFDQAISWNTDGVVGMRRFLERVWRFAEKREKGRGENGGSLDSLLHQTIKKVTEDIEALKMNTAVSSLMVLFNAMEKDLLSNDFKTFLQLFAPFAPHIAEELWEKVGERGSIHQAPWPAWDESKIIAETAKIVIQIMGKTRDSIEVGVDASQGQVEVLARGKVASRLNGKEVVRVIFVQNRLINFVIS